MATGRLPFATGAEALAVRLAAGLAVLATASCGLGLLGLLDRPRVALLAAAALAGLPAAFRSGSAAWPGRRGPTPWRRLAFASVLLLPVLLVALYPPVAFDETLYHLPTVQAFAATGSLPFLRTLRVPVFPHLDEVLRVPLLLFGGESATHLLPFAATAVTALLVFAWAAGDGAWRVGWTAAALQLSSPIVVLLATTGYVEANLTMLTAASLHALGRWDATRATPWLVASALFGGAAAGVKYLGLFWLALAGLAVLVRSRDGERIRATALFCAAAGAALAPWYGRILLQTGNPLFPFLPALFGPTLWSPPPEPPVTLARRLLDAARLPWDTLLERGRVNGAPPFTPWFALSAPLLAWHALRSKRTAATLAATAAWGLVWSFLPHDARYLVVAVPPLAVATARALHDLPGPFLAFLRPAPAAFLLLLPGLAYAVHRVVVLGPLPAGPAARDAFHARHVPYWPAVAYLRERLVPGDVVFLLGTEHLRSFLPAATVGDYTGPLRFDLSLRPGTAGELAGRLEAERVRYVLAARRTAAPQLATDPGRSRFRLLLRDAVSDVWELLPAAGPRPPG